MSFHENLRTLRLARGLTQPALAEKADIEQSYLSKLENGRSKPSDDVLARLAQALDVKAEALQNGDETEERRQRWWGGLRIASLAATLLLAFVIGRVSAIYPLSLHRIIAGANAAEDISQQVLTLAPAGIEVVRVSLSGRDSDEVAIEGRTLDEAGVTDYMKSLHRRFGGRFIHIEISPANPTEPRHFELLFQPASRE